MQHTQSNKQRREYWFAYCSQKIKNIDLLIAIFYLIIRRTKPNMISLDWFGSTLKKSYKMNQIELMYIWLFRHFFEWASNQTAQINLNVSLSKRPDLKNPSPKITYDTRSKSWVFLASQTLTLQYRSTYHIPFLILTKKRQSIHQVVSMRP